MTEVYEFLNSVESWFLATSENNKPHVRPMGAQNIYNGRIYFLTGKKKDVYKQLIENPNIEVTAYKDGKWIRINGKAILDESIEAQIDFLDHNPALKDMYKPGDANTAVFYFDSCICAFYSFTSNPRIIKF